MQGGCMRWLHCSVIALLLLWSCSTGMLVGPHLHILFLPVGFSGKKSEESAAERYSV